MLPLKSYKEIGYKTLNTMQSLTGECSIQLHVADMQKIGHYYILTMQFQRSCRGALLKNLQVSFKDLQEK